MLLKELGCAQYNENKGNSKLPEGDAILVVLNTLLNTKHTCAQKKAKEIGTRGFVQQLVRKIQCHSRSYNRYIKKGHLR